jgi:thioredoxin 1
MNSTFKVLIVVALIIAIASITAIKKGRSTSPTPPEAVAASTSTPTSASIAAQVATGDLPRLVDLGSTTCVPCKMMAPILEEIKAEYAGRLQVEFIDVRASPASAEAFRIRVIPTQIFFDPNGEERFRHEGFFSKEDILGQWGKLGITLGPKDQPSQPVKDGAGR